MSLLTTKAQSLKFESKTQKEGHLEEGKPQKPANCMKSGKAK
jgi:hypothetical protein